MNLHHGLQNLLSGRPRRKLLASALSALAVALIVARVAAALVLGNWTVTYNGVTYDHVNNTTKISYTIVGAGSGPGMSHLTFGVCAGILPNVGALVAWSITPPPNGSVVPIVGLDPTTGVTGLKLECAQSGGCSEIQGKSETKTYTYTVNGIWAVDPNGTIGIKAGGNNLSGTIQGLDCDSINLKVVTTCADFSDPEPFYRNVVTEANQSSPATNVELVDELSPNVAYAGYASSGVAGTVSCSGNGQNPETVTCTLSQLADGETWTLDIFVTDNTGTPMSVSHLVTVSADEVEAYNVNNEDACSSTTPVTLAYFNAERSGSTVRFEWTTASETGNVGFNLYAVTDGGLKRLNAQLIPSAQLDSMAPSAYSFVAKGVTSDRFMIEDVDMLANARQHGQFVTGVAYGSPDEGDLIDWDSIHAEDDRLTSEREALAIADTAERIDSAVAAAAMAVASVGTRDLALDVSGSTIDAKPIKSANLIKSSAPVARLAVNVDGMVRVTYEQLLAAGIDLKSVASSDLALINRGAPVPIRVESLDRLFGPGSTIEFYGEAVDGQYTRTNAYDLFINSARRQSIGVFQTANILSGTPAASYVETVTVDRNLRYAAASQGDDPWHELRMFVHRSPGTWTVPVTADSVATGVSTLKIKTWGGTSWDGVPDHHIKAAFNDHPIVDHIFDGITTFEPEVELGSGVLREGANVLSLTLMGDTGADYDLVYFDALELRYPRAFVARDGSLSFSAADRLFRVSNLTSANVTVYRFVDGTLPVRYDRVATVAQPDGTYIAMFEGTTGMARYVVLSAAPAAPADIEPLRAPANIAATATDYLVIAHPNFIHGILPLVDHHRARGLRVKVVDVRDVYDTYGHGIVDPLAIKAYIKDAKANGVRFVLLVGGDTYDYLNYANPGAISFIPTLYARTDEIVKYAPVDPQLADVDDDGVPDLAIGRLPVRTTAELDTVVAKTLAYANKSYGQTGLFAADVRDPRVDFSADSNSFIAQLPSGWAVERAYIDEVGLAGARSRILAKLNEGVALTSFIGHSSTTAWTFSGLFRSADAATLTNAGRPTVVTQWGCWNTYFVSPSYNSLGHAFMVSGDRGAAAVLGASALTEARSEQLLGRQVMPRLTAPGATIGEAVLEAKQAMAVKHPHRVDVLLGWTLLGDPALQVAP